MNNPEMSLSKLFGDLGLDKRFPWIICATLNMSYGQPISPKELDGLIRESYEPLDMYVRKSDDHRQWGHPDLEFKGKKYTFFSARFRNGQYYLNMNVDSETGDGPYVMASIAEIRRELQDLLDPKKI